MPKVQPQRLDIFEEEVRFRASVSEFVGTKIGGAINFINERQVFDKQFFINGPYTLLGFPQLGIDGAISFLFDAEIVGILFFNLVKGTSGTTTFDVRKFTGPNTPPGGASIFSVKPAIASSQPPNAYAVKNFETNTDIVSGPWATMPSLVSSQLNAGEFLVFDLLSGQVGAENCGLILYFRPR